MGWNFNVFLRDIIYMAIVCSYFDRHICDSKTIEKKQKEIGLMNLGKTHAFILAVFQ